MRLALLHYTLPPVIGGVERLVRDQAAALTALGHEVALFDRSPASKKRFSRWLAGAPGAVLVHNVLAMPFALDWAAELRAQALKHRQHRWVNWVHDVAAVNPHYQHLPWGQDPALELLRSAPEGFVHVTVSKVRQRDYARATGLRPGGIRVIPNGVDLAALLDLTPRVAGLRLWRHDLVLFHPARLIRRKNIELGIQVTAGLAKAGVDVVYLISGAPDPHQADGVKYHGELRALAKQMKVADQVIFLGEYGELSDADVRSLYQMADALFFPSTGEGFGLPLVEAAAHRLPVFCSNIPAHREVLGRSSAVFFTPNSAPPEIVARILRWRGRTTEPARHRLAWRAHDMLKICQEHLEPLLLTANE